MKLLEERENIASCNSLEICECLRQQQQQQRVRTKGWDHHEWKCIHDTAAEVYEVWNVAVSSEIFHRFRPKFPQSLARNFFLWKQFSSCEKVIFFSFLFFRCIYSLQTDKNGNIVLKNATWAVNFCFFFTEKEILLKLFYSLRSPLFSVQWSLPEKSTIFLTISVRRWSKIFFMKVKNKKHFLLESINLSQPWTQYVDRVSHDRDFSHFFHFHLPWKWAKYAKISNNRAEKSEKSRSPKTRKMSPKPLPNGFPSLFRFNCTSWCKSL